MNNMKINIQTTKVDSNILLIIICTFTLAMILYGCRSRNMLFDIYVLVMPPDKVYFKFKRDKRAIGNGVLLKNLTVSRVIAKDRQGGIVWHIFAKTSKFANVTSIAYGSVPPGFIEEMPARPLVDGQLYDVIGGTSEGAGGVRFVKK